MRMKQIISSNEYLLNTNLKSCNVSCLFIDDMKDLSDHIFKDGNKEADRIVKDSISKRSV